MEKVFLGIDPGFHITGYAIIKRDTQGKTFLIDCDFLKMNPKDHLAVRVGEFYNLFSSKIKEKGVTNIVLETSFLGKNAQTFLKLGYLRGILYLLANQNNTDITEFAPREIKQTITGYGGASKEQVAIAIKNMFPILDKIIKTARNDVTDALGITLCGLWASDIMRMSRGGSVSKLR